MTHEKCSLKTLDKETVSRETFEGITLDHLVSVCELHGFKSFISFFMTYKNKKFGWFCGIKNLL
jgi:hypothetical protein